METRSDRAGWIVHRERQNEINSIDLTRNYLNDFSGDGISGSKPLEVRVETGASRCAGEMQRWIREGPRRREPLSVAGTRLVYFKRNFGEEREKEMRERCHLELQMPDRGNKEGCPSRISEERQSKSYRSKVLRGKWICRSRYASHACTTKTIVLSDGLAEYYYSWVLSYSGSPLVEYKVTRDISSLANFRIKVREYPESRGRCYKFCRLCCWILNRLFFTLRDNF